MMLSRSNHSNDHLDTCTAKLVPSTTLRRSHVVATIVMAAILLLQRLDPVQTPPNAPPMDLDHLFLMKPISTADR
jgi:hypothetical protein